LKQNKPRVLPLDSMCGGYLQITQFKVMKDSYKKKSVDRGKDYYFICSYLIQHGNFCIVD
jgi:hypothetical protein